jgi:hypothetical protein
MEGSRASVMPFVGGIASGLAIVQLYKSFSVPNNVKDIKPAIESSEIKVIYIYIYIYIINNNTL